MASDDLFSREEVLGGLPARKARALLFQIEIAAAYAVENSRRSRTLTGFSERLQRLQNAQNTGAPEDEYAWLRAFGRGRQALPRPSIRQIERYASEWRIRMPESPRLRAALAHLLGRTYRFTLRDVPNLRAALGLDTEAVQEAYRKLYNEPLESLYAPHIRPIERIRWAYTAFGKRLDGLPAFWLAFAYALFGNFPSAILILPVLAAKVGPLVGLTLLIIVGAINLITIAYMTEAVARSGSIQYRNAFLGRMTALFLGRAGASLVYGSSVVQALFVLIAGYIAFALSLGQATHLSPLFWVAVFTAIMVYRLWSGERGSSLTGDILLGSACIGLVLLLSLVGAAHFHPEYITIRSPALQPDGRWDFVLLGSVVGGFLMCYCGHTGVPAVAKTVLLKDPSGHALIRGSVLGTFIALLLQCVWLLTISGAVTGVNPDAALSLAGSPGTALEPFGATLGTVIALLGVAGVCLFMGLDNAGGSDIIFNLIRERLPIYAHSVGTLQKEKGRLLFHLKEDFGDTPRIGLSYLGMRGGNARFRVDILAGMNVHRKEIVLTERWEAEELFEEFPELRKHDFHLGLELMESDSESARFLIATGLQAAHEGIQGEEGLSVIQSLEMEDEDRELLRWLMAHGEATAADAAQELGKAEAELEARFATLAGQRLIQRNEREGTARYRPRFARRRQSRLPQNIWKSLETPEAEPDAPKPAPGKRRLNVFQERLRKILMSDIGRFVIGASPVVLAGGAAVWLLAIGQANYALIIDVCGVLTLILSSGVFPILLLFSARRKGMHQPQGMVRFLGHPILLVGIYLLFMSLLALHGLTIWTNIWQRLSALGVTAITLIATTLMGLRGAFAARLSIELREDLRNQHQSSFRVMETGTHSPVKVDLEFAEGEQRLEAASGEIAGFATLRRIVFHIPNSDADELRVWVHRVTLEGDSIALPALLEVHSGAGIQRFDLGLSGGQVLLPLPKSNCEVHILLSVS